MISLNEAFALQTLGIFGQGGVDIGSRLFENAMY